MVGLSKKFDKNMLSLSFSYKLFRGQMLQQQKKAFASLIIPKHFSKLQILVLLFIMN